MNAHSNSREAKPSTKTFFFNSQLRNKRNIRKKKNSNTSLFSKRYFTDIQILVILQSWREEKHAAKKERVPCPTLNPDLQRRDRSTDMNHKIGIGRRKWLWPHVYCLPVIGELGGEYRVQPAIFMGRLYTKNSEV